MSSWELSAQGPSDGLECDQPICFRTAVKKQINVSSGIASLRRLNLVNTMEGPVAFDLNFGPPDLQVAIEEFSTGREARVFLPLSGIEFS